MNKHECVACGYIYDPTEHDNIDFPSLPTTYSCPKCGAKKEMFQRVCMFDKNNAPFDFPKNK